MTMPASPPPPDSPGQPTTPPAAPQAPVRRNRTLLIVAAAVGLVVVIAATIAATLAATSRDKGGTQPPATGNPIAGEDLTAPTTPATTGPTPAVSDIKLTPKVVDKECFGSAGCNLTIRVKLAYGGPALSKDDTWMVTYEVRGGEDGPQIGSLELTGTTFEADEEDVSTTSSKSKISIEVTDVEKVGI